MNFTSDLISTNTLVYILKQNAVRKRRRIRRYKLHCGMKWINRAVSWCCSVVLWSPNDVKRKIEKTINNYWTRLSKISWFVSGEQINYLPMPKAEANNWSARHWQITIFCEIEFNNCFIIQQDNVFMHLTSTLFSQLFIPTPSARFHFNWFCTKNTTLVNSAFANN